MQINVNNLVFIISQGDGTHCWIQITWLISHHNMYRWITSCSRWLKTKDVHCNYVPTVWTKYPVTVAKEFFKHAKWQKGNKWIYPRGAEFWYSPLWWCRSDDRKVTATQYSQKMLGLFHLKGYRRGEDLFSDPPSPILYFSIGPPLHYTITVNSPLRAPSPIRAPPLFEPKPTEVLDVFLSYLSQ